MQNRLDRAKEGPEDLLVFELKLHTVVADEVFIVRIYIVLWGKRNTRVRRSAVRNRQLNNEWLHRAVYILAAEGQEVVRGAGQVESIRVDLDFWQRIKIEHLFIKTVKVKLAGTLLNYTPVFES